MTTKVTKATTLNISVGVDGTTDGEKSTIMDEGNINVYDDGVGNVSITAYMKATSANVDKLIETLNTYKENK